MRIGGLQKHSLIDYPGKVSCVVFLAGCNFRCPYCHNPSLVENTVARADLESKAVYDFLEKRRGLLDAVVVSGGEPTLQDDLFQLLERSKGMGYAVKLDTNGSRPQVIKKAIEEGLVDYVAMDVKTDPFRYASLVRKKLDPDDLLSSIRIIMESAASYEFRTTCVKPVVDAGAVESIARYIEGAVLYALQGFNDVRLLAPEFIAERDEACLDSEMRRFQDIARPWVKECIVR